MSALAIVWLVISVRYGPDPKTPVSVPYAILSLALVLALGYFIWRRSRMTNAETSPGWKFIWTLAFIMVLLALCIFAIALIGRGFTG